MRISEKKFIHLRETKTGQNNIVVLINEQEGVEIELSEQEFGKALAFMRGIEPFMRPI